MTVTQTSAVQPDTITTVNTDLGTILADATGSTLYIFATDIPGSGKSTCTGSCPENWPAASADIVKVSSPLVSSDFSLFTRTDGTEQVSYRGHPLYTYRSDTNSGDVKGEGIGMVWFTAKPDYTVMIAKQPVIGSYLTDSAGMTLYFFTSDTTGTSACTGSCLSTWPAFSAGAVVAPSLLKTTDFRTVSRSDGVQQLAYMGRPLYRYAPDKKPGDTFGQGINNRWFVANISGSVPVIPMTVATTVQATKTPYSRSYGGGY
ncbi:MAG TPA: hypothetical protein PLO06_01680 [Methanoregulaceae archaeon]|nr:hypothetical protein [Methanoregulaceae archaeon]